jgi:hypothetical protein
VLTHLCHSRPQEASYEKFPSLQLCADHDQPEIRLWIHIAGLLLDALDLRADSVHHAINQLTGPWQELWRDALSHPCA